MSLTPNPQPTLYTLSHPQEEAISPMTEMFIPRTTDTKKHVQPEPQTAIALGKIAAEKVNFYYGGTHQALFDVSLSISEKQVTAFIGPSGCGKSTFLRILNRMNDVVDPTHRIDGRITLDGHSILGSTVDLVTLRRRVGMVFQKSNPFPKSIYKNVAYGPSIHGINNKAELDALVEKSLQQAGLWDEVKDRLDANAMGLSGGQQQRLCIARALAVGPDALLMDEPTSALDPKSTRRVEELITELRNHYTIVIVTHNMQQAVRVSDRTAFFYEGHLVEAGETRQVFDNPTHSRTKDYITGRFG